MLQRKNDQILAQITGMVLLKIIFYMHLLKKTQPNHKVHGYIPFNTPIHDDVSDFLLTFFAGVELEGLGFSCHDLCILSWWYGLSMVRLKWRWSTGVAPIQPPLTVVRIVFMESPIDEPCTLMLRTIHFRKAFGTSKKMNVVTLLRFRLSCAYSTSLSTCS